MVAESSCDPRCERQYALVQYRFCEVVLSTNRHTSAGVETMTVNGRKFNTLYRADGIFVVLRKTEDLYIVQYYGRHYTQHARLAVASFELRQRPELIQ